MAVVSQKPILTLYLHHLAILSSIETNVNYFDDPQNPTEVNPRFEGWGETGWKAKGGFSGTQRLARYFPNPQPASNGMSKDVSFCASSDLFYSLARIWSNLLIPLVLQDRDDPNMLGWYQKRNFTVKLVNPAMNPTPANVFQPDPFTGGRIQDPSDARKPMPVTHAVGAADASWVICAINIQGQQRYRYSSYNGLCWDGVSTRDIWNRTRYAAFFPIPLAFPQQRSYFACKIDFRGSPGLAKRDQEPIAYFGGDPIYGKSSLLV